MALRNAQGQWGKYLTLELSSPRNPVEDLCAIVGKFQSAKIGDHRWIVGGKLCLLLNQWGLIVGWACDTANVADNTFQWLIRQCEEQMIVLVLGQFM